MDLNLFYNGQEFEAYRELGAHAENGGVRFETYAPAARAVSVIGEFNGWQDTLMERKENGQFFTCFIPDARPGQMYKYRIYRQDGSFADHADPYAFWAEKRPGTASRIFDMNRYCFHDQKWMEHQSDHKTKPLNIYEVHMGSFRRMDGYSATGRDYEEPAEGETPVDPAAGWYSYEQVAQLLIPYLQENHYNYLELMPLAEYPADESWGYQATGFFAATSRYGNPDGLKKLVDDCHQNGIGVILDVVTVHFAVNDYGLAKYDGTCLYEYPNDAVGHSEWGSCNFMHSRGDVCSFLNSASAFWLDQYHFDGLRFDAVGNLIYWQGNEQRGTNTNALRFLRNMNQGLKKRFPDAMLIAEDSSAYPNVTAPVDRGGLGFDYKWDMGWMNDTLAYLQEDPQTRLDDGGRLTFSMHYFYKEHYLLPLSHDEVVHGKGTILDKMNGEYWQKFPQARTLYTYMFAHPGKKLNFMGNEIGQLREWSERREQDWNLLKYPIHDAFHHYCMELNRLYMEHSALWAGDYDRKCFEWVDPDKDHIGCFAFVRRSRTVEKGGRGEELLCLFNFARDVQIFAWMPHESRSLIPLLDSDEERFGGRTKAGEIQEISVTAGRNVQIPLQPFSARIYAVQY